MSFLESTDVCSVGLLGAVLWYTANWICQRRPDLLAWAKRIGVGAFLLLLGYSVFANGIYDFEYFLARAFQSAMLGLLIGGAIGVLLPILSWLHRILIIEPYRRIKRWNDQRCKEGEQRNRDRHEQAERRQQQRELEHTRPERERAAREAAEQKRLTEQNRASDQKRREMARLECQLLYDRFAKELSDRLPRDRIDEYFAAYMTDSHSPEAVEERAALLKRMIEESLESHLERRKPFVSLQEIAQSFNEQRQQIASLPYDEETKESMLAALEDGEQDAIREFLRP